METKTEIQFEPTEEQWAAAEAARAEEQRIADLPIEHFFEPLGDRILIEPEKPIEKTKGGVYLPDTAQRKQQEAKVLAVGKGKRDEKGNLIPMECKVGDRILINKYGGVEIQLRGKEYQIIGDRDALGRINHGLPDTVKVK